MNEQCIVKIMNTDIANELIRQNYNYSLETIDNKKVYSFFVPKNKAIMLKQNYGASNVIFNNRLTF